MYERLDEMELSCEKANNPFSCDSIVNAGIDVAITDIIDEPINDNDEDGSKELLDERIDRHRCSTDELYRQKV